MSGSTKFTHGLRAVFLGIFLISFLATGPSSVLAAGDSARNDKPKSPRQYTTTAELMVGLRPTDKREHLRVKLRATSRVMLVEKAALPE